MKRELSPEQRAELESQGTTISEEFGGAKKTRYWTPDGREILALPSMRTWIKKKDSKVINSGIRDANLDAGWLLQPPTKLKPYCSHCDNWHNTQKEIDACGAKKKTFDDKWAAKAKRMRRNEGGEIEERVEKLESGITDIKQMLAQLLKKE